MFNKDKIQDILKQLGDDAIFVEEITIVGGLMDGKKAWVFTSYYQTGILQGAERYSKLFIPEAPEYMLFYPTIFPVEVPNIEEIVKGERKIRDFLDLPPASRIKSLVCSGYGISLGKENWVRNRNLKGYFYIRYDLITEEGNQSTYLYIPAINEFDVISIFPSGGL